MPRRCRRVWVIFGIPLLQYASSYDGKGFTFPQYFRKPLRGCCIREVRLKLRKSQPLPQLLLGCVPLQVANVIDTAVDTRAAMPFQPPLGYCARYQHRRLSPPKSFAEQIRRCMLLVIANE